MNADAMVARPEADATHESAPLSDRVHQVGGETALQLSFAGSRADLLASQRLRYHVLAQELGAQLPAPIAGIDADLFDPYSEHLLVRDRRNDQLIGSCRILRPEQAGALGKCHADDAFDLSRLHALRPRLVELGRVCVAPGYRTGAVIRLLWAGIARFMLENGYTHLIGRTSIGVRDTGDRAASVFWALYPGYAAPGIHAARPHVPFPLERTVPYLDPNIPGVIRGYLRSGARICGMPAWDRALGAADLLMLLDIHDLPVRLARHFGVNASAGTELAVALAA